MSFVKTIRTFRQKKSLNKGSQYHNVRFSLFPRFKLGETNFKLRK